MSKILPSQLTDEELFDLLENEEALFNEDVAKIFNYNDDIVPFLSNYGITPGDTQVSKKLLHNLYNAYSKNPLDQLNFTLKLSQYISHDRDNFLINIDQFAISHHIYESKKTKDKTKSLAFQKHFNWFITTSEMNKGTTWIEGFILFYMYKDFCKSRRVNTRLGYVNFHKFLKLHFDYKRLKGNRSLWFKVDEKTANTYTEEEKRVIREARSEKAGRSQEEGQSKSEEASS